MNKKKCEIIILSKVELQSRLNRVGTAEDLILQLPDTHDGRNTWLLNYGQGVEAQRLRNRKGLKWIKETQSCETVNLLREF